MNEPLPSTDLLPLAAALLLLGLLSIAQRRLRLPVRWQARTSVGGITWAAVGYCSIGLWWWGLDWAADYWVGEMSLSFDFEQVFKGAAGHRANILGLAVGLVAIWWYSLGVGRAIASWVQPARRRLAAQLLAAGAVAGLYAAASPAGGVGWLAFGLMVLLSLVLLDLYLDQAAGASLAWLVLWLALLAAFGTALFFARHLTAGQAERLAFAQALAAARDAQAEVELERLAAHWAAHGAPGVGQTAAEELRAALPRLSPYLASNYQVEAFAPATDTAAAPPDALARQLWAQLDGDTAAARQGPVALRPNRGYFWYAWRLPGKQAPCLLAFRPSPQRSGRVWHELLPPGLPQRYAQDYLLYYQGTALPQRGQFERRWLSPERWPPPAIGWDERRSSSLALLYHRPAEAAYGVIVKEDLGGYLRLMSWFSLLFALLAATSALLLELNRRLALFPAAAELAFWQAPSLRHRIQLAVIGLSLLAFLFIGFITWRYFQQSSAASHQEQLFDTMSRLARILQQQGVAADAEGQLAALADLHQADLALFRLDGALHASSAPFLFEQGYLSPHLRAEVLEAFRQNDFRPQVWREQGAGWSCLAAYLALPDSEGRLAWALQVPYSASEQRQQRQALGFIGTLLSLYVFLLLIAGALAIAVANSITRPLAAIGERLRSFQLGNNEPLHWEGEDEIGRLVAEYNQMAAKLEESAEKLRQSEREGAWREMAKQVAHEIKNPLTPMKLSIQYLQQVQRSEPERARSMIERVSKTLVEQIDNLARIAAAFSDFAKMPAAQNETIDLAEVVRSAYHLFADQEQPGARFDLSLPEAPLEACADKGQLLRVLSNLLQNALQAIPEGREGVIGLELRRVGAFAQIAVRDNGSGIPASLHDKVFQPNFTTKSSGMGLGLAMCRDIAEMAGGRLYFETEEGKGTAFFLELPVG
jgi:two-component system, NtrC family, nitrogen regulation sensor histidine kinase NtrY